MTATELQEHLNFYEWFTGDIRQLALLTLVLQYHPGSLFSAH